MRRFQVHEYNNILWTVLCFPLLKIHYVEVWDNKRELNQYWSRDGQKGEVYHPTTHCELSQTKGVVPCISPTGKCFPFYYPSSRKVVFSSIGTTAQTLNEKPLHFKLLVSSNEHFIYNSFSQLPLSFIKEWTSHLFSRLVYGFVPNCSSLLFLNKLFNFLGQES